MSCKIKKKNALIPLRDDFPFTLTSRTSPIALLIWFSSCSPCVSDVFYVLFGPGADAFDMERCPAVLSVDLHVGDNDRKQRRAGPDSLLGPDRVETDRTVGVRRDADSAREGRCEIIALREIATRFLRALSVIGFRLSSFCRRLR